MAFVKPLKFAISFSSVDNAPINVMPRYPPMGQLIIRVWTEDSAPGI